MKTQEHTPQQVTLRNVRGSELPAALEQAGIGAEDRVDLIIRPVPKLRPKARLEEVQRLLEKIWAHPVKNPGFSEVDLYDEQGLPK